MRGHIRKRGERSWAVVVDIDRNPATGRRRQKWFSVKGTKRDAERRLAKVIHELNTDGYAGPTQMSVGDFLRLWMRMMLKRPLPCSNKLGTPMANSTPITSSAMRHIRTNGSGLL